MTFHIQAKAKQLRCPDCRSRNVIRRGFKNRRFRAVPIGRKPVFIALAVPRIGCRECGAVKRIKLGFADERVSYTQAFERYVLELSRMMTIQDIARHLGVGWDMIKEIQKRHLLRQFWIQPDNKQAERFLTDWIRRALASGITMPAKFARTLGGYRSGLLSFYDHQISTGPLEGMNNKIKTMKRQAYGFRDLDFFKLKIMAIHEAKYTLTG